MTEPTGETPGVYDPAEMCADARSGDILVVDDDPANLAAIEATLEDLGRELVLVDSGRAALRALLQRDFALILLDVRMPGLDGFETARLIRSRPRSRHVPIIFVSAYPQEDAEILHGYRLGAVDFLFKPIVPEVLRAKVSVFVQLQERTAEVQRQANRLRELERRELERRMTEERQRWEADALREESQRKDRFLAVLAHELRNPLSPILTGVAVLRGRSLPPDSQRHLCDCMDRQVRHLVRLVDDLLDVSRISQGKIVLRKERVELRNTLTQAVESVRNLVDERRHVLAVDVAPEPLVVDGDAVRLVQIVSNLLNNAVRYTPHGGRIHLVLEREASDAVVRVADNGRGIPADLLERVFDIFVQQRGDGRGLGIGLTLVRQLVTLHGGTVRAASPGEDLGSEFVVRLPLAPAAAEVAPAPVDTDIPLEPGLRVVLVEDENDVRLSTTVLLQEWGVDVRVASNGAEGVALIQEQRPDVALVDISMPEMDGFAVARRVHELLGDDAPRLVALTGYGREEDRREGSAAGFDHYLIKPASPHDLRRALRRESDAQDLEHPSAGDDPAGAETHDEGGGGRRSRRHPPSPAGRATGAQAR